MAKIVKQDVILQMILPSALGTSERKQLTRQYLIDGIGPAVVDAMKYCHFNGFAALGALDSLLFGHRHDYTSPSI